MVSHKSADLIHLAAQAWILEYCDNVLIWLLNLVVDSQFFVTQLETFRDTVGDALAYSNLVGQDERLVS